MGSQAGRDGHMGNQGPVLMRLIVRLAISTFLLTLPKSGADQLSVKRLAKFEPNAYLRLEEVNRDVDLSNGVVISTLKMKVLNTGGKGERDVIIAYPSTTRCGFVEAFHDRQALPVKELDVLVDKEIDHDEGEVMSDETYRHMVVRLHKALETKETIELTIIMYLSHAYEPLPRLVGLQEAQKAVYRDTHFIISPYFVKSQTTTVRAEKIERVLAADDGPKQELKASRVTFGPQSDQRPYSPGGTFLVHARVNRHLGTFNRVERELELSHWGQIQVHESYSFTNDAAGLKGEFSQIEVSEILGRVMGPITRKEPPVSSHVAWKFNALFPSQTKGIQYYDQIGNISSSFAGRMGGLIHTTLVPRYPVLGQWNSDWMLDYSLPITSFLTVKGQRHVLTFSMTPSVQEIFTDRLKISVSLPPGSSNIEVNTPRTVSSGWRTTKKSWFDIFAGRPVAEFMITDVYVPKSWGQKFQFEVSYNYVHSVSDTQKPMLICALILIPFLIYVGVGRLSLRIATAAETKDSDEANLSVSLAKHIAEECESILFAHDDFIRNIESGHTFRRSKSSWAPICTASEQRIKEHLTLDERRLFTDIPGLIAKQTTWVEELCKEKTAETPDASCILPLEENIAGLEQEILSRLQDGMKPGLKRKQH
eukprot:GHVN01066581.1.p1 GENE.GHVN01066581.1~~GHVN01066581.1.p1  ORF type:complete len:650 (+),score=48.83 GHVN01066581.1:2542-4491(+)